MSGNGRNALLLHHLLGIETGNNVSCDGSMKKILKVKLTPTKEQAKSLLETIETFNDACNWIFRKSFEAGTPYQMKLHHMVYFEVRERFPALTSQMIVRAIAKVSDNYRTEKKSLHFFKKHSAMEYDKRLLSFKSLSHASMATVHGRITVSWQKAPDAVLPLRISRDSTAGQWLERAQRNDSENGRLTS